MNSVSVAVVIPNLNGEAMLDKCLDSLLAQSIKPHIIVVENGSTDNSLEILKTYPQIEIILHSKNKGFAGGVNAGIRSAMKAGYDYVALFNNDATAEPDWLEKLLQAAQRQPRLGLITGTIMSSDKTRLDSTGEFYTSWGLPFPRGRNEAIDAISRYNTAVFGVSGGASLYTTAMFEQIGLFDEAFFAYYEDVDLSFRAQLAGWQAGYVAEAVAYHQIGATSAKIKGFVTYQTMKNLPMLLWKNVPLALLPTILPRFSLAYFSFFISALSRGQLWPATKGVFMASWFMPQKLVARWLIQRHRQVSVDYIRSVLIWDLPPGADRLRAWRCHWRHLFKHKINIL